MPLHEMFDCKARELGTSDPEIAEAVVVAAALRAGEVITHGTHAMKGTGTAFSPASNKSGRESFLKTLSAATAAMVTRTRTALLVVPIPPSQR